MNEERYTQPLALFFSICCYIVFVIFSSTLLINLISFDISDILIKAKSLTIINIENFRPEPYEPLIYLLAMFALPVVVPFFYFVFIKVRGTYTNKKLYNFSCWLAILFCLTLSLYSANANWGGSSYFDYYLNKTVFNRTTISLYVCSTLLLLYLILKNLGFIEKYKIKLLKLLNKILKLIVIFIFISLFFSRVFDVNAVNNTEKFIGQFDAFFYPIVQVINSQNPLYADGFWNQYGLYPHFLEPIFFLMGGVSIFKFSLIIATLTVASYYMVYYVMDKIILNKFFLYSGFLSIFWFQYLSSKAGVFDYYFQYIPLRTFFPCLLIFIAYKYTETPRKTLYNFFGYFIGAVSILWNPDSGMVVAISWFLFSSYFLINKTKESFNKFIVVIKNISLFFLIIFFTFIVYYLYILLRYEENISLIKIFTTINLFSYLGMSLQPLPIRHPWIIVMTIYTIGFSSSLLNINSKEKIKINSIIFLLSSLGIGLFMYFVGRTINLNLLTVSLPAIILISLYGDLLFKKYYSESLLHEKVSLFIIIAFLSSSIVNVSVSWPYRFYSLLFERNQLLNLDDVTFVESNISFIKKYINKEEKVLILSGNQGIYHSETQTSSIFNVGVAELLFKKDYDKLIKLISSGEIKIFLDTKTYPPFSNAFQDRNIDVIIELINFIEDNYKIVDKNADIVLMTNSST